MYEIQQILAFTVLAKHMHFGKAAESLGIAQPTLSAQIRNLESEIGGPLFRRSSRNVELTALGEVFLKDARSILALVDRAKRNAETALLGKNARLVLGVCSGVISSGLFAKVLEAVHAQSPDLRIECEEAPPGTLYNRLEAGKLDAMLANVFGLNMSPAAITLPITRWPCMIAYRRGKFPSEKPETTAVDADNGSAVQMRTATRARIPTRSALNQETFIAYEVEDEYPHIVESVFHFEPKAVIRTPSARVMMHLIDAGCGVAVVPEADLAIAGPNTEASVLLDSSGNPRLMPVEAVRMRWHNSSAAVNFFSVLETLKESGAVERLPRS